MTTPTLQSQFVSPPLVCTATLHGFRLTHMGGLIDQPVRDPKTDMTIHFRTPQAARRMQCVAEAAIDELNRVISRRNTR